MAGAAALDLGAGRDGADERGEVDIGRDDPGDLAQAVGPVEAPVEQPADGLHTCCAQRGELV